MKKSLIALAALAAAGVASAQSSVTLWGVLDAGVQYAKQGTNARKIQLTTSGLASSQLGFRGVEDLGGGMAAGFWLETMLQNDTGNAQGGTFRFGRRSTVSLAGDFGEVRLGRDYAPTFWNHTVYDPFGTLGSGAGSNITGFSAPNGTTYDGARVNNGISYLYGISKNGASAGGNGLFVQLTGALPESTGNRYAGGRIGYNDAALSVALAASSGRYLMGAALNNFREVNLGGSYNFGVLNLMGKLGQQQIDNTFKQNWWSLGATIPVGNGYIPVSYNQTKFTSGAASGAQAAQFAAGYVYNLSKRTSLYATGSYIRNNSTGFATFAGGNGGFGAGFTAASVVGARGTAADFGLKHSF